MRRWPHSRVMVDGLSSMTSTKARRASGKRSPLAVITGSSSIAFFCVFKAIELRRSAKAVPRRGWRYALVALLLLVCFGIVACYGRVIWSLGSMAYGRSQ